MPSVSYALRAARRRIEHCQHLLEEDIARIGRLGAVAADRRGGAVPPSVGAARAGGAVVAFGSDWPIVTLNPMLGMKAAVTGRTLDGRNRQTQANITLGEALRCYTSAAAYALLAENEIGRIANGCRADFVIWDGSPFEREPQWSSIRPAAVFVDGRCVYSRDATIRVAASPPGEANAP